MYSSATTPNRKRGLLDLPALKRAVRLGMFLLTIPAISSTFAYVQTLRSINTSYIAGELSIDSVNITASVIGRMYSDIGGSDFFYGFLASVVICTSYCSIHNKSHPLDAISGVFGSAVANLITIFLFFLLYRLLFLQFVFPLFIRLVFSQLPADFLISLSRLFSWKASQPVPMNEIMLIAMFLFVGVILGGLIGARTINVKTEVTKHDYPN